jgi:hypothetical protein
VLAVRADKVNRWADASYIHDKRSDSAKRSAIKSVHSRRRSSASDVHKRKTTKELDRSILVRLPALTDGGDADALPEPLRNAYGVLNTSANAAAVKARALIADARWSEGERQRQLSELCASSLPEFQRTGEVAAACEALADEQHANALRKAIGRYESPRLLAIAQSLAGRSKEQKLSAILKARQNADYETMASFVSAPRELGIGDDFDPRMYDAMIDALIDSVDPDVRQSFTRTRFATARMRAAVSTATDTIRRLTKTEASPSE